MKGTYRVMRWFFGDKSGGVELGCIVRHLLIRPQAFAAAEPDGGRMERPIPFRMHGFECVSVSSYKAGVSGGVCRMGLHRRIIRCQTQALQPQNRAGAAWQDPKLSGCTGANMRVRGVGSGCKAGVSTASAGRGYIGTAFAEPLYVGRNLRSGSGLAPHDARPCIPTERKKTLAGFR